VADLVKLTGIRKTFMVGARSVPVLQGIDLCISRGEFVAVMGASGSGKSTLLHILGCLDRPTEGTCLIEDQNTTHISDRQLSHIRARKIGFVFQTFNLLHQLTVFENVELSFHYAAEEVPDAREKALQAIVQVGLMHRIGHKPPELSGGEMQRAAIARAICKGPSILLADEPTGSLDSQTGRDILDIFQRLHAEGATIVMVTHDPAIASRAGRIITVKDGSLVA
jgi:putative ABC transport system ATP-binding protein